MRAKFGLVGKVATEADIDAILAAHGIRVEADPLEPRTPGYRLGTDLIIVADTLTPEERLIVKAHELGHILLHRGKHISFFFKTDKPAQERGLSDRRECQANAFAAALLLGNLWGPEIDNRYQQAFERGLPIATLFGFVKAANRELHLRMRESGQSVLSIAVALCLCLAMHNVGR